MSVTSLDMGLWWIVLPEPTINLVTNPSFEIGTTGWVGVGSTAIAQSSEAQYRGAYSLKITPTASITDGTTYDWTAAPSLDYTVSFDFKGTDTREYLFYVEDVISSINLVTMTITSDGGWARYALSFTNNSNTSMRLVIIKNSHANTDPFYIDGVQIENKAYATDYIDGDKEAGVWLGTRHASRSQRLDNYAGAGRPVNFSTYNTAIKNHSGAGLPPIDVVRATAAQGTGSIFRYQHIKDRQMGLDVEIIGDSLIEHHGYRGDWINALNPQKFATQQPYHVRYHGSGPMLDIGVYLSSGLDGSGFEGPASSRTVLDLVAAEPEWTEVPRIFTAADIASGIGTGDSTSTGAAGNHGGGGSASNTSPSGVVLTVQEELTNTNYIVVRDATGAYSKLGTGLVSNALANPNNTVSRLFLASNNYLYALGSFTTIGGTSATRISYWDGGSWNAMGTGLNGTPTDIDELPNGDLVVVGSFTSAGGVSNTQYIAVWDISAGAWISITSTAAPDSAPNAVAADSSSKIYTGGDFTTIDGVSATRIACYDGSWNAMGTGAADVVRQIIITQDGNVLASGGDADFGGVADTGGVASWNGSVWSHVLNVINDDVAGAIQLPDGTLVVYGDIPGAESGSSIDGENIFIKVPGGSWYSPTDLIAPPASIPTQMGGSGMHAVPGVDDEIIFFSNTSEVRDLPNINGVEYHKVYQYDIGDAAFSSVFSDVTANLKQKWLDQLQLPTGQSVLAGGFSELNSDTDFEYLALYDDKGLSTFMELPITNILPASDGLVYAVGGYSSAGGVANTTRIAYWDDVANGWNALGTGASGGPVYDIAELANGDLVAVGNFASMGGISNTQSIAVWDKSASVWTSIGDVDGAIFSVAVHPGGDIYIAGRFRDAGGVSGTKNLAKYVSGTGWVALSAEPEHVVSVLKFDAAGQLYLGGMFKYIGTANYDYIAKYNPTTNTFSGLENGTNSYVTDIDIASNGHVYVAGDFTQLGTVTANRIGYWTGTAFKSMLSGLNKLASRVQVDNTTGRVYVGGVFTTAGGNVVPDSIAVWTGTTWFPLDANLPDEAYVTALKITPVGGLYIGFNTAGTVTASKVN